MKTAPYGSWESPVTTAFVAGKDRNLGIDLEVSGEDLYFLEARPDEGGRIALMRRNGKGEIESALPSQFNVRTRYLEYGGKSFHVAQDEIFFVNFSDQQVYRCRKGGEPVKISNDPLSRFADFTLDAKRNRLIAVREKENKPESINSVCVINLQTGAVTDLVSGHDFFNCARLNASGDKLLWISWNHPNMAWNGTELFVGDIASDGTVKNPRKIAGSETQAISQARWRGEEIHFVAELENWANLYRHRDGKTESLFPMEAEFGYPDWNPGQKQYDFSGNTLLAAFQRNGSAGLLQIEGSKAKILPIAFTSLLGITAGHGGFYSIASFRESPPAIIHVKSDGSVEEIYSSYQLQLSKENISRSEAVQFPTEEGGIGHAWFYRPKNERYQAPEGEKPPLIVVCHGGPTAVSTGDFKKSFQFWTTRGYAVVDVNYGGSAGYGRAYRERLRNQWGVVDVNDCIAVVKELGRKGLVDPKRVAIRGGSAGGFTTLAALTFTKGVISVGASYFGVSDMELLAKETHKLEARYMDQLVGPYPEMKDLYRERSPLFNTDQLNSPIIFFQGAEDRVVPPNQSELMYEALRKKGIDSEYHLYPGEGHGFRKAETTQDSLKREHSFYARQFQFPLAAQDR